MPTTIQNPQLMSPSCGKPDSVVAYDDGAGKFVVPALLAPVESDPDEPEHENAGNDIGKIATDQLSRGRRPQCLRVHYLGRDQHLPGGRSAVAPEDDHRQ